MLQDSVVVCKFAAKLTLLCPCFILLINFASGVLQYGAAVVVAYFEFTKLYLVIVVEAAVELVSGRLHVLRHFDSELVCNF